MTLLGASASAVQAFEIFGIKFFESEDTAAVELIDPLPYAVEFSLKPRPSDEFQELLQSASGLLAGQDRPASGRAGLLASARKDYGQILDALYAEGRFGGTVSIRINGREASSIPLNAQITAPARVAITIVAGPVYRFSGVGVENNPPSNDLAAIGLANGEAARTDAIRDAGVNAVDRWREAGYAKAEVADVEVVADHASRTVSARLRIDPGRQAKYGETSVTGNKAVNAEFLKYMANLPQGKVYSPEEIEAARRRLLRLDTFRLVTIDTDQAIGPDGFLPVDITVNERKPRRIGVGATVSTLDGIGVEGFWLHRNILGSAERLRFDGSVSGIGRSTDPLDYDYSIAGTFIKPGVLTPDTDYTVETKVLQEITPNYTTLELNVATGLQFRLSDRLSGEAGIFWNRSRVDDQLGRRRFTLVGLDTSLTYDSRDIPLDARRGYYLEANLVPFYENGSGSTALRSELDARVYTSFGQDDRYTLAGRAKIGSLTGISQTGAPQQQLFFSGGGGSVRGYKYLANGVTLPGGAVIGGRSLLDLSGEFRARVSDSFGVVGFVDAGLVGPDPLPDFSDDFKVGIGAGLRWSTGLGPLRVDLAHGLDRTSRDPAFALYIGLGQSF